MFWERFYNACKRKGVTPTPTVKELNIAAGMVTKWKSGSIPNGETLIKISHYLGCSVDYLLGITDEPNILSNSGEMTSHEKKLIAAYRNKPEMQNSVDKLLDIYEPAETIAEDISETIRKIESVSKAATKQK